VTSVLFVDDEPDVLNGLRNRLRRHRREWDMHFVVGGQLALDLLEHTSFDIVVSDMRMPDVDGVAVLEAVRSRHPSSARIVLSGYADPAQQLRAFEVAHQWLAKPCRGQALQDVIGRLSTLKSWFADPDLETLVGQAESLPAVPRIYHELLAVFADERSNAQDAAAVVMQDVSVSAAVLRAVNSAFFAHSRRVTNIGDAVVILGEQKLGGLVLAAAATAVLSSEDRPLTEAFHRRGCRVARLAEHIAPPALADDAFAAGLLHDIGLLIKAGDDSNHPRVGAYLLALWGLPVELVQAVATHHDDPASFAAELNVSSTVRLADALVRSHDTHHAEECAQHKATAWTLAEHIGHTAQISLWHDAAAQ
jgi:HD-like signal output (HDOD) protein